MDVLWVLIIGATFLTPFSKPDGALSSPAETRARYLRTSTLSDRDHGPSFYVDVLALIPYWIVRLCIQQGFIGSDQSKLAIALSLVPQMDRYMSLSNYFKTLELSVNADAKKIALLKFTVTLFGAAHWVGCSWWAAGEAYNFDGSTWVKRYFDRFLPAVPGWVDEVPDEDIVGDLLLEKYGFESKWDQYELSLYWGFQ
ncbi:hypothetical protein TeGR_g5620, partial [Tetraparma gracilis]